MHGFVVVLTNPLVVKDGNGAKQRDPTAQRVVRSRGDGVIFRRADRVSRKCREQVFFTSF